MGSWAEVVSPGCSERAGGWLLYACVVSTSLVVSFFLLPHVAAQFIERPTGASLRWVVLGWVLVYLCSAAKTAIANYLEPAIICNTRRTVYERVVCAQLEQFDPTVPSEEWCAVVSHLPVRVFKFLALAFQDVLPAGLLLLFLAGFLIWLGGPGAGTAFLLALGVSVALSWPLGAALVYWAQRLEEQWNHEVKVYTNRFQTLQPVLLHSVVAEEISEHRTGNEAYTSTYQRVCVISTGMFLAAGLLLGGVLGGTVYIAAIRRREGKFPLKKFISTVLTFSFAATYLISALEKIPLLLQVYGFLNANIHCLPVGGGLPRPQGLGAPPPVAGCTLRVVDLQLEPLWTGLNLDVTAGEKIALVGTSGCGKSTFAATLARLVQPTSGAVYIDGEDSTSLPLPTLRNSLYYMPHTAVLREWSVLDNICWFRTSACVNRVRTLLEVYGLTRVFATLPQGLESVAVNLSAGQLKILLLLRALVVLHPLYVLDEPFASLDPDTLTRALALLRAETLHCTVVLITHEPSGVDFCDRVLKFPQDLSREIVSV